MSALPGQKKEKRNGSVHRVAAQLKSVVFKMNKLGNFPLSLAES